MTPEYSTIKKYFVSDLLLVYLLLNKKITKCTFSKYVNSLNFATGDISSNIK